MKKSRDKPMVIHTKEKIKLHIKEQSEMKQKKSKIPLLEKLPNTEEKRENIKEKSVQSVEKMKMRDKKRKFRNQRRKLQFFLDKMNAEEEQKDSVAKLVRDLVLSRISMKVKEVAPFILLLLLFMAVIVFPIIGLITIIYHSPFAILFPTLSFEDTIQQVLSAYITEFQSDIDAEMENAIGYDACEKIYLSFEHTDLSDIYYDILAVYMVKHGNGEMAVDMTEEAKENLKTVFRDMCSYFVSERTDIRTDEEGNEQSFVTKEICIRFRDYEDMIAIYDFQSEEQEFLAMLMQSEDFVIMGGGGSITPERYQAIVDAVSDENGKKVVEYVLSKVGYPYSQAYRDSGRYYDCSSLAYYAWKNAGVNLMYEGANTAAAEGKFCYDNHYLVPYEEMQPGDLIFYSYGTNGRFFNITHVAVYVGDGMVVEAANERIGVVYRAVQNPSAIVFIGRPR